MPQSGTSVYGRKKPPGLAAAFGGFDGLALLFGADVVKGVPGEDFGGCHSGAKLGQGDAEFVGHVELEQEELVLLQFGLKGFWCPVLPSRRSALPASKIGGPCP